MSRRQAALGLLASALAGLPGCDKPEQEILPYAEMPERLVAGVPLRFATTLSLGGYGRGVVCTSHEGRPTKIEGNPAHPASLGTTDVFAEAELMGLYDPDRSRVVRLMGRPAGWEALLAALQPRLAGGVHLLTGPLTSPTLLRLIGAVPGLTWHMHDPVGEANALRGAELAFGRPLAIRPRLDRADVMLALDADPLGPGPDQIRNSRAFAARRLARAGGDGFSRLYAVEPAMSLTGAMADHHRLLAPDALHGFVLGLGAAFGAPGLAPLATPFLDAVVDDLRSHPGAALVLAGEALAPELHALVHWINARLGAPVEAIEPVAAPAGSLEDLVAAIRRGGVQTLVVMGNNPAYDAPDFAEALRAVPVAVHHGQHVDETAALCAWHVPAPHALEDWGDLRATDGTASLVQPLIRPLYDSRSAATLLGALAGDGGLDPRAALRATWSMPEPDWRRALEDGVVAGSASPVLPLPEPRLPEMPPAPPSGLTLLLRRDAAVWDGSFANNAWLQECPRPLTRQVWGNAALIAPAEASARGLRQGDVVRLEAAGRAVEAPVLLQEGIAPGVVALTLGYGRRKAGAIGDGIGTDAYPLRRQDAPWAMPVALIATGRRDAPVLAQEEQCLDGEARDLLPLVAIAEVLRGALSPPAPPRPSLYPERVPDGSHAWAMTIDTTLCTGCNACVVACQAENNIPVVGPEEIARGRDMHWLRIDTYIQDAGGVRVTAFQPVPCMHCEQAPCEPVCPVAASVHDHEGLNVQVYNRCIGTRFCQANCPYKVRRFNFSGYADGQEYANQGDDIVAAQRNPEVTVRARGVMEKCTYCVQRISGARRAAKVAGHDNVDVVTACQAACPSTAIRFGDLTRADSAPSQLRQQPHHYALLGELGTRPRTTYLKRARNPNPALEA